MQALARPIFDCFYLELDEPIALGDSRGAAPSNVLSDEDLPVTLDPVNNVCRGLLLASEPDNPHAQVVMYFTSSDCTGQGEGYFDGRSFLLDLETGFSLASAGTLRTMGLGDLSLVPDDIPDDTFVLISDNQDWSPSEWASNLPLYAGLLDWMLTYMVTKGVEVIPEPLSRQQRRQLERKGLPNPWHVVRVEPRFTDGGPGSTHQGPRHGYRYDVMGFMRRGRHKLRDGTYRETIEWVRPHQRGLRNQTYVPKTSRFDVGKVEDKRMRDIEAGK